MESVALQAIAPPRVLRTEINLSRRFGRWMVELATTMSLEALQGSTCIFEHSACGELSCLSL